MTHPLQVRNLRRKLKERFQLLIDMSDWHGRPDEEQAFLSRAVAALAVKMETDCSDKEAAEAVIDCETDCGIDAVAVKQQGERQYITLVQAKWSNKGEAGFGSADVSAVMRGLRYIRKLEFHRFGSKIDRHTAVLERALKSPSPRITIVLALVTKTDLHHNTKALLEEEISYHNRHADLVNYKVLAMRDLYDEIFGELTEQPVNLDVELHGVGTIKGPFRAYYGTVSTGEVAQWYAEYGHRLTARNIRDALDIKDVNERIRMALIDDPDSFWYLSNGITLICNRVRPHGRGSPSSDEEVGLHLEGASVINGAQTVNAVYQAVRQNPKNAANGRVLVRIISLEGAPEGFGDRITVATNTQNPTEEKDFRSRQPEQAFLRHDFALSLGLDYVIKRGVPNPPEENGCRMEEAALALAAAHPSPKLAARAKHDESALWQETYYKAIFGENPGAHRVWRCVCLLRAVRRALSEAQKSLVGRAATAAAHGDLLLTHVLFQTMDTRDIDDDNEAAKAAWKARLAEIPERVRKALGWMVVVIDGAYGRNSQISTTVRSVERVEFVAQGLYERVRSGEEPPADASLTERKSGTTGGRQLRAVAMIVEAGVIPNGTVLEFRPVTSSDRRQLPRWIEEDPRRGTAVWRSHESKPLIWDADGQAYSPSRLVRKIRLEAMGNGQQVQGTLYWHVPGKGSLADIARELREAAEAEPQDA